MLTPHHVPSSDLEHARALSKRLRGVEVDVESDDPREGESAARDYVDLADAFPARAALEPTAIASNTAEALSPDVEAEYECDEASPLEEDEAPLGAAFAEPESALETGNSLEAIGVEPGEPERAPLYEDEDVVDAPLEASTTDRDEEDAFPALEADRYAADPVDALAAEPVEPVEPTAFDAIAIEDEEDESGTEGALFALEADEAEPIASAMDTSEEDFEHQAPVASMREDVPPLTFDEQEAEESFDLDPLSPVSDPAPILEAEDDGFDVFSDDEGAPATEHDAVLDAVFSAEPEAEPTEDDGFDALEMAFDDDLEPTESAPPTAAAMQIEIPDDLKAAFADEDEAGPQSGDDEDDFPIEFETDEGPEREPQAAVASTPDDAEEDDFDSLFSEILED